MSTQSQPKREEIAPVPCSDVPSILVAADQIGFPVILSVKHGIDLELWQGNESKNSSSPSFGRVDLVTFVTGPEETHSVATALIENWRLECTSKHRNHVKELEKALFRLNLKHESASINTKLQKNKSIIVAEYSRRRDAVRDELLRLKRVDPARTKPLITVSPASHAQSLIYGYEYLGNPLWDPQHVDIMMPCDFGTTVMRSAYLGSVSKIQSVGVSKELKQQYENRQNRPMILEKEIKELLQTISELESNQTSETLLRAAKNRLRKAKEDLISAKADADSARTELKLLEAKVTKMTQHHERVVEREYFQPEKPDSSQTERKARRSGKPLEENAVSSARQRYLDSVHRRTEIDLADEQAHPANRTIGEQVNACNNQHVRWTPILLVSIAEQSKCTEHLLDMGAIQPTAEHEIQHRKLKQQLDGAIQDYDVVVARLQTSHSDHDLVSSEVDRVEEEISALRKKVQEIGNTDLKSKIKLNTSLAACGQVVRELRFRKAALKRSLDEIATEKNRLQQHIPSLSLELEKLILWDHSWTTPLHTACQTNRTDVVAILLKRGALARFTDVEGNTALHIAASEGHFRCIDQFVKSLDVPSLSAVLKARNARGQLACDVAYDPLSRQALARAFHACGMGVQTRLVRIQAEGGEQLANEIITPRPEMRPGQAGYPMACNPFALA